MEVIQHRDVNSAALLLSQQSAAVAGKLRQRFCWVCIDECKNVRCIMPRLKGVAENTVCVDRVHLKQKN